MNRILSALVKYQAALYKLFLLLVASVLLLLMFPHQQKETHYNYSVGAFWMGEDLVAPFDFVVSKTQSELDQEIARAKSNMLLYYTIDTTAHVRALDNASVLFHENPVKLKNAKKTIDSIYNRGYIEFPDDEYDINKYTIVVLDGNVGSEHRSSEFVTPHDVFNRLLVDSVLVPSVCFDPIRTKLEFDSRMSQIRTSTSMMLAGQPIISRGEYISEEKARILNSLDLERSKRIYADYHPLGWGVGQIMLFIIAFLALYMFMKITNHPILDDNRKLTFVVTIIMFMAGITSLLVNTNPEWVLLAPLCIAPILMRIFFDMRVALYIHLTTVIILGNMVPNSFEFIFYQLVTGMMSLITVKNFESRGKFFLVALVIFLTYSLIYIAGILSQDTYLSGLDFNRFVIFFLNAILTLLSYPLIYLFEHLFGFTTDLTLLEISSTNTPALRTLSRQAPGTFQHSMQVSNLSEDLINEIGGNALLAKVGGLYHDIGKTAAPLYFTENQNTDFNPHNDLEYDESALIITNHVKDGIDLGRKYHLPPAVIDFIRTHHGTTYTGYFYAKQKLKHPDGMFDESLFQYPGPTPYSRETAVVMLVDSVEAACKSLKNPDKEKLHALVDSVIDGKIRDNQLNNCDITFSDITKIRRFLKDKMVSIYHVRVAYPTIASDTPHEKQSSDKQ